MLTISIVLLVKVIDWRQFQNETFHFYVQEVQPFHETITRRMALEALKRARFIILTNAKAQKYEDRITLVKDGPILQKHLEYFKVFYNITYKGCKEWAIKKQKKSQIPPALPLTLSMALVTKTPFVYLRGFHIIYVDDYAPLIKRVSEKKLRPKTWDEFRKFKIDFQMAKSKMNAAFK